MSSHCKHGYFEFVEKTQGSYKPKCMLCGQFVLKAARITYPGPHYIKNGNDEMFYVYNALFGEYIEPKGPWIE